MIIGDFDNKYRDWLNNQEPSSKDEVWEAIEDNLDFNDVWNKIETDLDKNNVVKKHVFSINFSLVAQFLLIFFLFTPKTIYDSFNFVEKHRLIFVNNKFNPEKTTKNIVLYNQIKNSSINNLNKMDFYSQKLTSTSQTHTNESSLKLFNNNSFENQENLDSLNLDTLTDKQTHISSDIDFVSELKLKNKNTSDTASKNSKFKIIDVGLIYGLQNTWLLNNETKSGFDPNKLNNTLFTLNRAWGINSTFQLLDKHLFCVEFYWKSFIGQNYQEYIYATFTNTSVRLQYATLQTMYIFKPKFLPGNFLVGAYLSNLQMAQKQFANKISNVINDYSNFDYGTMLGYQIQYSLSNKIVLKASFRFNYSLHNIYEGNNLIIKDLNKTTVVSNSLNFAINYVFN